VEAKVWSHNEALPTDALVYGAAAPAAVALKQLDQLGVRAAAAVPPLLSASSFGNASVLVVEQTMSLPDMDVTFAWLAQSPGRCVIWSGFSTSSLNRELYTAAGVAAVDIRTKRASAFSAFGRHFNFSSSDGISEIEFSVKDPVQRPQWGVAKVMATDDRGVAVLHRHQKSGGGVFVMSSLSPELAGGMLAKDVSDWFVGLLSLCSGARDRRSN